MNAIYILVFTAIMGAGADGLEQKKVEEHYKFDNPIELMAVYDKLIGEGVVTFEIQGGYDKREVRTVICEHIGHDWKETGDQPVYELEGSTETASLKSITIDQQKDINKESEEFVYRLCRRCDWKEYWKYQTSIILIKREGE